MSEERIIFVDDWNFQYDLHVRDDIYYVGASDHRIRRFEGQFEVHSMAYNSYVIMDEQIAVFDTVDKSVTKLWLENLQEVLGDRQPNYLIIQHMEPDHSGSILDFLNAYPGVQVIASKQAFTMMKQFYGNDYAENRRIVGDGDTLDLGKHQLTFVTAPMVHWPEVIVTYDSTAKALFSADGFGKFGAIDSQEYWECEARRYYFGIVGKYGAQVQALLKKAANLDIQMILPLHGPLLLQDIDYYLAKYDTWSSYRPEDRGICIVYSTVYGHTREAAEYLERMLEMDGYEVQCHNLATCDVAEAVEDAFRYSHLVLATTTYNGDIFPTMKTFINKLLERNYQNRTVALIENGSWAPTAAKVMKGMLEGCKDITFMPQGVRILSALNEESQAQLKELLTELRKVKP
jgi:flavorubredoxin